MTAVMSSSIKILVRTPAWQPLPTLSSQQQAPAQTLLGAGPVPHFVVSCLQTRELLKQHKVGPDARWSKTKEVLAADARYKDLPRDDRERLFRAFVAEQEVRPSCLLLVSTHATWPALLSGCPGSNRTDMHSSNAHVHGISLT